MSVVESKAVYSVKSGRYLRGKAEHGHSDLSSVTPTGIACFIEVKARGKRHTLRPSQWKFLMDRIEVGAFACCTDSAEMLESLYDEFEHRRNDSTARNQFASSPPSRTKG